MENRVRVLIVEDDVVDQMAFKRFIDHEKLSYDVVFAESVPEAKAALEEQSFDIALVDYLIGNNTAFDLIEETKGTPVIIITGRGDEDIAVKAMKAGALDYLVKDIQGSYLKTLPIVIENTIARRHAENELAMYRERLEKLVEERTAELASTNQQLVLEIRDRMQIEKSLRQYTERLNILRELDRIILETQSSQGVVQEALHHFHRLVTCQLASVVLINKDTQEVQIWVNDGQDSRLLQKDEHFPPMDLGQEAELLLWQDASTLIENSTQIAYGVTTIGTQSILNVPLMFQQELVGVLTLVADNQETFGEIQVETVCDVANQLAIAVRQSRLHEQIQHHATELEERVVKRTAELQAANARLQILSRAKDEFVSNVSHELRTPITNMKLYHELMNKRPDKYEHYSAILQRETDRLESLIEALLMLSRLDQGREKFTLTQIELNEMLEQFVADREALAATKGITLTIEVDTEPIMLEADSRLLEQVLSILLTNALAYTPSGGHVHIRSAKTVSNDQQWAGFSISDTGPGISADEQKHLFERFFRGNAGYTSNVPGTGLGLAIAKEIIDRHKGQIEVYSEGKAGQGTIFSVWLAENEAIH